ncbi:MAG TPA: BrnT family toxin [Candidatus Angelobacter sp.]|nr:BrnT family toxin [Candidatus Angelobacter sp.]
MIFTWDVRKAAANLKKHGIDFREGATIFQDPLSATFPDLDHSEREQRFLTIGETPRRRILVVAHTEEGDTIRIISAREATQREKRFYEENEME